MGLPVPEGARLVFLQSIDLKARERLIFRHPDGWLSVVIGNQPSFPDDGMVLVNFLPTLISPRLRSNYHIKLCSPLKVKLRLVKDMALGARVCLCSFSLAKSQMTLAFL